MFGEGGALVTDGTVLIVDDEPGISELASRILDEHGYATLLAASGEEALEVYRANPTSIGLVIMDLGMSGIGGLKSIALILGEYPGARIVVSSGTNEDEVAEALSCGAIGCLAKPYRMMELVDCVNRALAGEK